MKIYAPVKTATGTYCSVRFVDGVGETNDPHLINWFKEHGYKLSDDSIKPIEVVKTSPIPQETVLDEVLSEKIEPNLNDMTPNEIREWAKANGHGSKIKNIRNKEKLIEVIKG